MAISIDLKLIREIVFNDDALLKEMLEEWKSDSLLKIQEIRNFYEVHNLKKLFNKIHELKTNFSMIHCSEAIRFSETIIKNLEILVPIQENEILKLEEMIKDINRQLQI